MDYMVVISAVVLGLSVLATLAKFLDWFIHSDPRTMVRTTRWALMLLLVACIPLLVVAIANQQWSFAMLVGAGMLVVPTLLKWRTMFAPLRAAFDYFRPKPKPFDMEIWDTSAADDPETVRRAAAILEAYVSKASVMALRDERSGSSGPESSQERRHGERGQERSTMSRGEALEVLDLEPGADEAEIRSAHKRLLRLVHPDHGGSAYLAKRVYQARDTLLGRSRKSVSRAGDDERA